MKYLKYCLIAAVAISIAAAGSLASAQNLLANPGFEDPVTTDGPPFQGFWEAFTGAGAFSDATTAMPRTGLQSLEMTLAEAGSFAGAFQEVGGLTAGDIVTFSGWHKSLLEAGGTEIRLEYRDTVNDAEVSRTPNFTPAPGSDWEEFALTDTVPAGADAARAVYAIQSFGAGVPQQVFLDDTSFAIVPEPASIALLGCAGSGNRHDAAS